MPFKRFARVLSSILVFLLVLLPSAQALTVEQARQILQEMYVDELPAEILEKPTLDEILAAVGDPYTVHMTGEEYAAFLASMNDQTVVGIGVGIEEHTLGLLITSVLAGSPAERAGLVQGDIITAVDGNVAEGMTSEAISALVRGEEGSAVSVTVLRADGSSKTVSLTRALVVFPATTSDQLDGHIGVITCNSFGDQTLSHFQDAVKTYGDSSDRWIIDLRANPGGQTGVVSNALGLFLGKGNMIYFRNRAGEYGASPSYQDLKTLYPVVVITSNWSASGAEVFAAAVRDYSGSGAVVGGRTFGKGVGQDILDSKYSAEYFADGSAFKITTIRWFSPAGNACDQVGILPHLLISDENAPAAAYLLCGASPRPAESPEYLRIDLGTVRFFIHIQTATSQTYRPAFTEILEACAPGTSLFRGTASGNWVPVTPAEAAQSYGLSGYTPRSFSDTAASDYEEEISTLASFRIVKGGGDGTFHPKDSLTRADLCALLAQAMNYRPVSGPSAFPDVPEDAWYAPYVNALYAMGVVNGYGDGLFHPLEPIDHEQFITILARTAQRLNIDFYELAKDLPAGELDTAALSGYSPWAREHVWLLSKSQVSLFGEAQNLLFDAPENIHPASPTSREEAAALLYNILVYTGILVI